MIARAIKSINPNANFRFDNDDINNIEWLNGTTPISKSDIEAKINELQTEYNNLAYARAREIAYPSLQEFAEAYCEKEIGGDSTKWNAYETAYNKVRTDNPKE
jgi:hypothetical protein|tara:strand:+ start:773 stop:1081 length:309 start_codon:yes stop_codon:yes gene_type:complete